LVGSKPASSHSFWMINSPLLRSALQSIRPMNWSPYSIGRQKYPCTRFGAGT
jgi:hypothetical protein